MNQRSALALILVGALGFAAYQAVQLVLSGAEPVADAPAPPQPPPPQNAANRPAGTMPYDALTMPHEPVGLDVPFHPLVARRVTASEVKGLVDGGRKVVFVDTRGGVGPKIEGAVIVPEPDLDVWARTVSKSSTIVVYCACAHEATAEREVLALQKLGFKHAYALLDGLLAWEAAGLPTEQARRQ